MRQRERSGKAMPGWPGAVPVRQYGRIASPGVRSGSEGLPHVICSPGVGSGEAGHEAGKYGDA